jgi:two-component system, OmpR family, phosphate regulon sensor histidine kinase PhoR
VVYGLDRLETAQNLPTVTAERVGRFLHVLLEPRSYLNALYMLLAFPMGLTYFLVLVVGAISGAVLTVVAIGVLVLLACLGAAWLFAIFERELAIVLLGAKISPLALPEPDLLTPWQMLRRHLQRPTTWRSLAYLLVKLPFGIFATWLTLALIGPSLAGIFIPFGDFIGDGPRPELVAAMLVPGIPAIFGLALSFHILNAVGRWWGRFAADMLGVSAEQHQLWEARRRAEQADLSRRELIMNVSHELRTPIATIQAHIDSMLLPEADRPAPAETERRLRITAVETRRLSELIEDLLMLARADSNELKVTARRTDLGPIVDQVVQSMAPLARQERQVTLKQESTPDGSWAVADPDRLTQVLSNLVRNAINYTPEGGVVSIQVAGGDPDRMQIGVSDTGMGISTSDLDHVFERFYRADSSRARNSGGFGLGLSIARELVEAMGGTLTATSQPGLGSTFWITLKRPEA